MSSTSRDLVCFCTKDAVSWGTQLPRQAVFLQLGKQSSNFDEVAELMFVGGVDLLHAAHEMLAQQRLTQEEPIRGAMHHDRSEKLYQCSFAHHSQTPLGKDAVDEPA